MPATPRDILKPRQERIHEVMESIQYQAGQANAQQIVWGLEGKFETKKVGTTEGEYTMDGVSLPVKVKATTGNEIPAAAKTGAGQKCFVLFEINKGASEVPEVFMTVSALTTGTPVLPALTAGTKAKPGRIAIFYLEVPESFTPGTSEANLTTIVPIKYSAGNVSPVEGF